MITRLILRDLLAADAQRIPHWWAATLLAHVEVGRLIWGWVALWSNLWMAAVWVPVVYLVAWEGLQFWLVPKRERRAALAWDCLLDAVGVAFGCWAAYFLATDADMLALFCQSAIMPVAAVGWSVRQKRLEQ